MLPAPPIDSRTSDKVVRQVLKLLTHPDAGFSPDQGASHALIEIFGRFAELIIERLNQVPGKNLLAFLDLIGASQLPPQPARVPLTFMLANGSTVDGLVPAGTQVAALQAEGETTPVIFETEEELVVTAARLTSLFVRQPDQDKYADYGSLINSISADEVPVFLGRQKIEHILYLGHETVFSDPGLKKLTLTFVITPPNGLSKLGVVWEVWNGNEWTPLSDVNVNDGTEGWTTSGDVTLDNLSPLLRSSVNGTENCWLRCRLLTPIPPAAFGQDDKLPKLSPIQIKAVTFQGTALTVANAIANDTKVDTVKGFFPFGERPKTGDALYLSHQEAFKNAGSSITLNVVARKVTTPKLTLAWEFWDGKSWSPLTQTDTTNSLTTSGSIVLTVPGQPVSTTINGIESFWIRVRIDSGNYGDDAHFALNPDDKTKYLYADADLNRVKYADSDTGKKTPIPDPYYGDPSKGYKLVPANLAPPFISSLKIDYSATQPLPALDPEKPTILKPEAVLTYNDFDYQPVTSADPFKPFQSVSDTKPTLYLGFTLPAGLWNFPNRKLSFYAALFEFKMGESLIPIAPGTSRGATDMTTPTVAHNFIVSNPTTQALTYSCEATGNRWSASVDKNEVSLKPGESKALVVRVTVPGEAEKGTSDRGFLNLTLKSAPETKYGADFITYVAPPPDREPPELVWQYSNATAWSNLTVRDYSENLTKPGLIEFLAQPDFQPGSEFGSQCYWLRATWDSGEYLFEPRLRGLVLNTIMGTQAVTITDEVLGSSNETSSQQFRTNRAPVLAGPQLYVREPELPPANEQTKIEDGGTGVAIQTVTDATGRPQEIWVRWDQMPDFYGSKPRDRHYVLDNLTGEVRFGDGKNGLIPPAGSGNIRMSRYRTGGGAVGNKPAGTVTQLKTTVPYVQQVVNYLAATGGSEGETTDSLLQRAPRSLRHGDRAVTVKDYEDLALLASTEVARARCIPLANLISDQSALDLKPIKNGTVSLIIVPRSTEAKSAPSLELIGRVQDYVSRRQNPVANLVVTGPKYLAINVTVDVTPVTLEGAGEIKLLIARTVSGYLHPLTGGTDGNGWDFGRYPHRSNLYSQIEALTGVDHVNSLELTPAKDSAEVTKAGEYFLVCSGLHTITLTT